ncbi:unnamed protein product, partial [Discosporangium mesarthrocarpum]
RNSQSAWPEKTQYKHRPTEQMLTFDLELPFSVREARRRRLSLAQVVSYRDIALFSGHIGSGLSGVKQAFTKDGVEATKIADIMRQVDVSSTGSLGRQEFLLALDRTGIELDIDAKLKLFRALDSASSGRGSDIEMFVQLVNFWGGGAAKDPLASPFATGGGTVLPPYSVDLHALHSTPTQGTSQSVGKRSAAVGASPHVEGRLGLQGTLGASPIPRHDERVLNSRGARGVGADLRADPWPGASDGVQEGSWGGEEGRQNGAAIDSFQRRHPEPAPKVDGGYVMAPGGQKHFSEGETADALSHLGLTGDG